MKVREDLGGDFPPFPSPELLISFTILFLMVVPGGSSKAEHKWCFLEAGALQAPLPSPSILSSCWNPGMGTGHPQPSTLTHLLPRNSGRDHPSPECARCARAPFPGGNPSSAHGLCPFPWSSLRMGLSFPGQGARAVLLLTWAGCCPQEGLELAGTSRDGGQSWCGQELLGSACPS